MSDVYASCAHVACVLALPSMPCVRVYTCRVGADTDGTPAASLQTLRCVLGIDPAHGPVHTLPHQQWSGALTVKAIGAHKNLAARHDFELQLFLQTLNAALLSLISFDHF